MKKLFLVLAMLLFSTTCYGWSDNDYPDEHKAAVEDVIANDDNANGIPDTTDAGGGLADAPIDGTEYLRKDGAWAHPTAPATNPVFSTALSTNLSYSGIVDAATVGESVAFGQLLFHNLTDGEWYLATGGATAAELPVEGMSLGSATDGNSVTILRMGYARNDAWAWTVDGTRKMLYASTSTSGAIIENPSLVTAGQYTQTIGTINSATTIFFNPGIYFQTASE